MRRKFKVGERVLIHMPGSWCNHKSGEVIRLNVESTDGTHGHTVRIDGTNRTTVIPQEFMTWERGQPPENTNVDVNHLP